MPESPSDPSTGKRVNFFDRQFLRARDLKAEQDYHLERRRRHNRLFHTAGVAEGLLLERRNDNTELEVSAGTAVDDQGREIVVLDRLKAPPPPFRQGDKSDTKVTGKLYLCYGEEASDPSTDPGIEGATRLTERGRLEWIRTSPDPETRASTGVLLAEVKWLGTHFDTPDEAGRKYAGTSGVLDATVDLLEPRSGTLTIKTTNGHHLQVSRQEIPESPLRLQTSCAVLQLNNAVQVTGPLNAASLTLAGALTVGGELRANGLNAIGPAALAGPLTVHGPLQATNSLSVQGPVTLAGPLTVNGPLSAANTLNVRGDAQMAGKLTVVGTVAAGRFEGDGSGLRNLPTGGGSAVPANDSIGSAQLKNDLASLAKVSVNQLRIDSDPNTAKKTLRLFADLDASGLTVKAASFVGDGSKLTGLPTGGGGTPANDSIGSAQLKNESGSLAKVSGGNLSFSGGAIVSSVPVTANGDLTAAKSLTVTGRLAANGGCTVSGDLTVNAPLNATRGCEVTGHLKVTSGTISGDGSGLTNAVSVLTGEVSVNKQLLGGGKKYNSPGMLDSQQCEVTVRFSQAFKEVPKVIVATSLIELWGDAVRIHVEADKITTTGFVVRFSTWNETGIETRTSASWIAIGR